MDAFLHAGMDRLVEDDRVMASGERGEEREIGKITAPEIERGTACEEFRRAPLQRFVQWMIAAQQARACRTDHAVVPEGAHRRLAQSGMARETEIVVGGKIASLRRFQ